jgi:membrane fusion protein, multidrug efflux system
MTRSLLPLSVVAVATCLLVSACDEPPEPAEVVRPIRAMRVADAEALAARAFPCRAEAVGEVNAAFEVGGRVIERPVRVGSEVKAGDLLARVDPSDFENALAEAQARVERARAMRDRVARALRSGAVAEQDLTNAQAELDEALAVAEIRARALSDTQLRAPFPGMIAATFVENFQNVQAKQPVMRLLDISSIECVVNIPENLISSVPYAQDITVAFDAFPGRPVPAVIAEIGREASAATRTFPVTLLMEQPAGFEILPGMAGRATGRAVLPDHTPETGYDLPLSAIFTDDGERSLVWVIDAETLTASKRVVETLTPSPLGMRVRGVAPGEWVATTAVNVLREGQRVRLPELERERDPQS